jgi:hypothetical protein
MDNSLSTIETIWNDAPAGYTFFPERIERYDPSSGFFYAPTEYQYKEIENCSDKLPELTWIRNAFLEFVRGEFGASSTRGECPNRIDWETVKQTSERTLFDLRNHCESELLYTGIIDEIIKTTSPNMSNRLYSLFTDPIIGNKDNKKNVTPEEFSSKIDPLIERQDRLRFIIPSFPFKDQNVFRTEAPASHVDLGEIALLLKMHILALAMFQVHPFGADWIIVSDGMAYAPIFQVDVKEVSLYKERLLDFRNQLNIQGTVNIIDLKEMTKRIKSKKQEYNIFDQTKDHIRKTLEQMTKTETGDIFESYRVLVRGMKWNMNTKPFLDRVSWIDLWKILNTELVDDVPPNLLADWKEIDHLGETAAYEYASFNLALRYHSVYDRVLPNSLRATIHPKSGQMAVPKTGDIAPWNGVGILHDGNLGPTSVETWPLYKIFKNYNDAIPHVLHGQRVPFYYFCPNKK